MTCELVVGFADVYEFLGKPRQLGRWRTATGVARDLLGGREPAGATVVHMARLLRGLHEVGLVAMDSTVGPPQYRRLPA